MPRVPIYKEHRSRITLYVQESLYNQLCKKVKKLNTTVNNYARTLMLSDLSLAPTAKKRIIVASVNNENLEKNKTNLKRLYFRFEDSLIEKVNMRAKAVNEKLKTNDYLQMLIEEDIAFTALEEDAAYTAYIERQQLFEKRALRKSKN